MLCPSPSPPLSTRILTKSSSLLKIRVSTFSNIVCLCKYLFYFKCPPFTPCSKCSCRHAFSSWIFPLVWGYVNSLKMYIEFHIVKVLFYSLYYIKRKSLCKWKCIINIFALQRIPCFNFILESTEGAWHAYSRNNCLLTSFKYWGDEFGNILQRKQWEKLSKEGRN